jgi:hypothetical protein
MKQLKVGLYIALNILFTIIIYFLSLRPLSLGIEQLEVNFKEKTFLAFSFELSLLILFFTIIFSFLSYLFFHFLFKNFCSKSKSFVIILLIYLIISILSSVEYFNFINDSFYSK